jgi:hypothetical protein
MMFRPSALIAALQLHENAPANAVLSLSSSGGKLKVAGIALSGADFRSKLSHADINTKSTVELPPMGVSFVADTSAAMPLYSGNKILAYKFYNYFSRSTPRKSNLPSNSQRSWIRRITMASLWSGSFLIFCMKNLITTFILLLIFLYKHARFYFCCNLYFCITINV